MDLFTIDTVGEQNLIDKDECNHLEVFYSKTGDNETNISNSTNDVEESSNNDEIDNDTEEIYDYGGESKRNNFF